MNNFLQVSRKSLWSYVFIGIITLVAVVETYGSVSGFMEILVPESTEYEIYTQHVCSQVVISVLYSAIYWGMLIYNFKGFFDMRNEMRWGIVQQKKILSKPSKIASMTIVENIVWISLTVVFSIVCGLLLQGFLNHCYDIKRPILQNKEAIRIYVGLALSGIILCCSVYLIGRIIALLFKNGVIALVVLIMLFFLVTIKSYFVNGTYVYYGSNSVLFVGGVTNIKDIPIWIRWCCETVTLFLFGILYFVLLKERRIGNEN